MISVGITGGIGSGKTTVCRFFEYLGIPIYYADDRAKSLMVERASLIASLKSAFGEATYKADGQLDRVYLADKVFNDEAQLKQLNSIVHPAVFQDTMEWMQKNSEKPYLLYESAIMFESGSSKMLNKSITVFSPIEQRLTRVMQRDNIDKSAVKARMDKQMSDSEKMELSDYVIYNDGSQTLISQILEIHKELIKTVSS